MSSAVWRTFIEAPVEAMARRPDGVRLAGPAARPCARIPPRATRSSPRRTRERRWGWRTDFWDDPAAPRCRVLLPAAVVAALVSRSYGFTGRGPPIRRNGQGTPAASVRDTEPVGTNRAAQRFRQGLHDGRFTRRGQQQDGHISPPSAEPAAARLRRSPMTARRRYPRSPFTTAPGRRGGRRRRQGSSARRARPPQAGSRGRRAA